MNEDENIAENLKNIFRNNEPQIWDGDFNSLTKEGYTEKEWNVLIRVRENNGWEEPKTEMTKMIV